MNNFLLSIDCEIHSINARKSRRYIENTIKFLDFFKKNNIKATFFVTGDIVKNAGDLLKEISFQGHEVASHGFEHKKIFEFSKLQFYDDVKKSKHLIEELINKKVHGYRAPFFSLTEKTPWAHKILADLNYLYSSSIMPADISLINFKGAKKNYFKPLKNFYEIPCPVTNILFDKKIPYLGGVYFRYLPKWFINQSIKYSNSQFLFSYLHPFDIDKDEKFSILSDLSLIESLIVHFKRKNTIQKLEYFKHLFVPKTFFDYLSDIEKLK